MIGFDFEYYQPHTVAEALQIYPGLLKQNKKPMYYGGGTEIISMGRMNNISTGAVIDIKAIPECQTLGFEGDYLTIGAGVTLTQIHEANLFPLLSQAGARVADHTIQNKITLGGNICGTIKYREAVLPLLVAQSELVIAGPDGIKNYPIDQIFKERLRLDKGEFLIQIRTERQYTAAPYVHVKRTKQDKINYPLLTICAINSRNGLRFAFSGLCDFPFRSEAMERELNNQSNTAAERAEKAAAVITAPISDDSEGSSDYRKFILRNLLASIVKDLEGEYV